MSAAAAKRTALAAVSIALLVAVVLGGGASGAERPDSEAPTPPLSLRVERATSSTVLLTWDASVDDVAVDGYFVYKGPAPYSRKDRVRIEETETEYLVRDLRCGQSAEVAVSAFDERENESVKVPLTVSTTACIDRTPPSTPSGFRQQATAQTAVVLAWDPATDDTGVVAYGVHRGVERIASPVEPNVTISGLSCGTTSAYSIDAVDAAGNRSALATAYVTTAACDTPTPPSTPPAPTPPSSCPSGQFLAQYFANTSLSGSAAKVACEAKPSYDWAQGGPGSPVPADGFSARWAGQVDFPAGETTFTVTADDGVRLWVDGTVLVDAWKDQSVNTYTGKRTLSAGPHTVKVEYYENGGLAVAKLAWTTSSSTTPTPTPTPPPPAPTPPSSCPSGQFLAQYFANTSLSGSAAKVACEAKPSYDWAQGGPGSPVPADGFSARWAGQVDFPAGETTFTVTADDGVRLWVDGTVLVDAWKDQSVNTYTGKRTLSAGPHTVKVEYYENGGLAVAKLAWTTSSSTTPTPTPTPPPPAPTPPSSCPSGQFLAQYFANTSLSGSAAKVACEAKPSYDWAQGGPGSPVPADGFSARWAGQVDFPAGETTFTVTADDGVRLWVDGTVLVDAWKDQSVNTYTGKRTLSAGPHTVKVEYYENGGLAVAKLAWTTSSSTTPTPPPPAPEPPVDTTPPTSPTNLGVSNANASAVSLTWNPSTDNHGVTGYGTYRDNAPSGSTAQPGTTVSGLTCGTAYLFEADAVDAAGNRSPRTSVIGSTSTCADSQPPTAPANVVATSRTATSIALSWTAATDNVAVIGYGLYRGATQTGTSSTTNAIFSGLTCNTNYTLALDAVDAAGNRSSKTTVMVATTACPDATPPTAPTNLATSNVTQTGLMLSWSPSSDNVGVAGYDVFRNGTKMTTVTSTSANQTGLACGTSYTFGVVARDAAGNGSQQTSIQAQTAACAVTTPPPSGPVTINAGGTYTGNWTSTGSTPAVTINTTEPVRIVNSTITNSGNGDLIRGSGFVLRDLTIENTRLNGGVGRVFDAEGFQQITVRNCTIEKTSGMKFSVGLPGSRIVVTRNRHHNIQGPATGGPALSQFTQFNQVRDSSIEVSWNEIVNDDPERSHAEDLISLFKTRNAHVHNNYFYGQWTPGNPANSSQNGITVEETDASNNTIEYNQLVATMGGPTIFAGSNNVIRGNRVIRSGYLPDGVTRVQAGYSGMNVHSGGSNNHAHQNVVGFVSGAQHGSGRMDWDTLPDHCAADNTKYTGTVTRATEQAEWDLWRQKLGANGISVGAS